MKWFRHLFFSCLVLLNSAPGQSSDSLSASTIPAENPSLLQSPISLQVSPPKINYVRLGIMGGITAGAAVGSYLYVKDVWWAESRSGFQFERTAERYALHLDKASHFWGAIGEADFFAGGFEWTGFDDRRARIYGALMSNVISLSVEMTDAFAVEHGFSIKDYLAGALGAWYPYLQLEIPALQNVYFKWSYWNHVPRYFEKKDQLIEQNPTRSFLDNYGNQTYWVTVNARSIAPQSWKTSIPPWLGLTVGARAGDVVDVIQKDKQFKEFQLYFSIDVDVPQLLPEEGPFWAVLRRFFSHIHFPAPAIRLTPRVSVFGFYM
ncbi:MAG: DUF2279 domain-containing protein [Ignavibacteriales bacterium]|nr:DUF2279 domain-containing protein [Ignavibacteriales bacterium]